MLRGHPRPGAGGLAEQSGYRLSGVSSLTAEGLPGRPDGTADAITPAVQWIHQVLTRLASTGLAPVPLPLLGGSSVQRLGDVVWETLSFLPGDVVGDRSRPTLDEVGALLARYHLAGAGLTVPERPGRAPVAELGSVVDWSRATATLERTDSHDVLRALIDALDDDLAGVGHEQLPRGVLHGDPTAHNVLASGDPLRPSALIDFDLAYHDPLAADIAFALWRSGRPSPHAQCIDDDKMRAFIAGYCRERPLSDVERAAIPVYLRARGLQMLAKRTRLGVNDSGPLQRVLWIQEHRAHLTRVATSTERIHPTGRGRRRPEG